MNLMINNLVYWEYHRPNGLSAFKHKFQRESIPNKMYTSTEGYIALMNYFSNSFLKSRTKNDSRLVRGMVSPTVDSNLEASFVESIQGTPFSPGFIETIVFPLSQCLGLPAMLYVLVMEKEEGLKSLLEIMGLRPSNYWKAHILFYTAMFMVSNALFYLAGRYAVGGKFFNNASVLLLVCLSHQTITFLGWDLSQIGMALFMSIFITNKKSALCRLCVTGRPGVHIKLLSDHHNRQFVSLLLFIPCNTAENILLGASLLYNQGPLLPNKGMRRESLHSLSGRYRSGAVGRPCSTFPALPSVLHGRLDLRRNKNLFSN